MLSRAHPVHLSGGIKQAQDSHTGVTKFSLPTVPHTLEVGFVEHELKLFLFFLDRPMDEDRGAEMLLGMRVFKSSHNYFCSSLSTITNHSSPIPMTAYWHHITVLSSDFRVP